MKLILSQQEIEGAVRQYASNLFTLADGAKMDIEFTAGRGDKGISVEVDISYLGVTSIPGIRDAVRTTPTEVVQGNLELPVPVPTTVPVSAAEQTKIDGRSKAAREAKKGGSIFGNAGGAATGPATPEPIQEASGYDPVEEVDDAPDTTGDDRAAEAAEILAEPEPEVVVTPPPPSGTPRKSLFS